MAFCAVVVAAGKSARFGGTKKEYRILDGRPVLAHSLALFLDYPACLACAAVIPPGGEEEARSILGGAFLAAYGERLLLVAGGEQRGHSVLAGLSALFERLSAGKGLSRACPDPGELPVLVHDGARPWASEKLVARVLEGVLAYGGCVPALPLSDTVKQVDDSGYVVAHPKRAGFRAVQTPQGFLLAKLLAAYRLDEALLDNATDDAELWSAAGYSLITVPGERENGKITFPEDLP
ncbi:MAG TPA: 2-C-methyl-D-erythritol 4-phosphate cytidylyltransferase [Spirochaetaceae bacterium]|nr:2-C-methyl-D-erythritol 4-phosphate cytidylyltransferase [Spirochaetaceae bacterium]